MGGASLTISAVAVPPGKRHQERQLSGEETMATNKKAGAEEAAATQTKAGTGIHAAVPTSRLSRNRGSEHGHVARAFIGSPISSQHRDRSRLEVTKLSARQTGIVDALLWKSPRMPLAYNRN